MQPTPARGTALNFISLYFLYLCLFFGQILSIEVNQNAKKVSLNDQEKRFVKSPNSVASKEYTRLHILCVAVESFM